MFRGGVGVILIILLLGVDVVRGGFRMTNSFLEEIEHWTRDRIQSGCSTEMKHGRMKLC